MARGGLGGLLLAGAAAFGLYKYSKMTEEQKQDLKNKGKKFVDENLGGLKDMVGGKGGNQQASTTNPNQYNGQSM
jgi:hypothetical protein